MNYRIIFNSNSLERMWLSLGFVRFGDIDCHQIIPGFALVRCRNRFVHKSRQRPQTSD